jgi:hypothetical protein
MSLTNKQTKQNNKIKQNTTQHNKTKHNTTKFQKVLK